MNLQLKKIFFCLLLLGLNSYHTCAQWMQWECKSNNSLNEFGEYVNDMKERGYAPVNLNIVTYSNDPRVSSIWQKANINDWACWYGMNQEAFIEKIKFFNQRGLTPIDIAVWKENLGELRFAAIWQKINYEGVVEIGVKENNLKKMIIRYSKKGYSPRDINGYVVNNNVFYTCIFDKQPRGQLIVSFGNSEEEFQKEFDTKTPLGYYPIDISFYNDKENIICNSIWAKSDKTWDSRYGYSMTEFQDYLDKKTDDGFVPIDIDQYYKNGQFYFSATLTKANNTSNVLTPKYSPPNASLLENKKKKLFISPVEQQTQVWCWLAAGEMIFKHNNIPNLNPGGNYQCGIIGSIFYNSICNVNCFNNDCIRGSGSNLNTVRMLKDYSWIASQKVFTCQEAYELTFKSIKNNIDLQKPILCGISPNRRQYYSGAEHVVVLIGYEIVNQTPNVIINDPFPYPSNDNPYLKAGAIILQKNQYSLELNTFTNNLFWHWSLSDIEIK